MGSWCHRRDPGGGHGLCRGICAGELQSADGVSGSINGQVNHLVIAPDVMVIAICR
jgi:hypothetical protein